MYIANLMEMKMKFKEAMQALLDGKKITSPKLLYTKYIVFDFKNDIIVTDTNLIFDLLNLDTYELCEEPEKTTI